MNRHAKATSAGSTQRQAKGLGRMMRGAFVTRGASSDGDGSGAPSYRGRFALLGLAALALTGLVLVVASAFASKQAVDWFGTSGNKGGELNNPRDIAVNRSGAGGVPAGTIYVADDNNHRVQRLDPDGGFVSAWGANVLTAPTSEVQTITVSATAGTYALSLGGATTAPIAYNASSGTVQTALRNLSTVGGINLSVSGTAPYTVTFNNSLQATNMPQFAVDDSLLTGAVTVATTTQGSGAYEVCSTAASCRSGAPSGAANAANNAKNGSLDNPQSVTVDGDTGNVYVSDRDNRRVNEYSATGTFIRSFGWGVDASVAGEAYEVCPAANRCTFGIAGAGAGQVGSTGTAGTMGIAVSQPNGEAAVGTVFLADSQNRRVNTYNLDGTSPSSFGSSSNFGTVNPRKIAVDSRGIVYASDSSNANEIDRYDTEDANGGGVGFLTSIPTPPLLAGPASTATSGLAVDPDSDGVGADEDVLYVLRDPSSGNTVVQQYGPTDDPGLTAAPTAVDDEHGGEAGFSTVNGLGLDDASGKLYIAATTSVSGLPSDARVYVLDDITAPAATLDPITTFDAHSAVFSGEVNPNGNQTGYRFEYVDDAEFQANGFTNAVKYPLADVQLGAGTASVPVEDEIPHHLVPGTEYHVRLVAKQVFTTTETIGGPQTFTTPGAAPSFQVTANAGEEEATLRAAIDPEGQAVTNYHFDWGPTASYGSSTPAGTLPVGADPVAVEEQLSGLTAGQEYHYRLVATNGTGTTTGPARTFTTGTPPQFPERGYEIASKYPTEGVPVPQYFGGWNASEDGNVINYQTLPAYPSVEGPILPEQVGADAGRRFISKRGPNGWEFEDTALGSSLSQAWSADGKHYAFLSYEGGGQPRLDPDDQNDGSGTSAAADVYLRQPDGSIVWITRDPRIPVGTPQTATEPADLASGSPPEGISADGKTIIIRSKRQLTDEDTTQQPPLGGPRERLYKWSDGQLTFIGERPDGSSPEAGSAFGSGFGSSGGRHALSRDGSRVIFSAKRTDEGTGKALYVQTDGAPTVEATKETGVAPLPENEPFAPVLRGASDDASRVFFTTASRLTQDAGATHPPSIFEPEDEDLYVYDLEADKVRDLTPRLDGLDEPTVDPASSARARVLGVAAESEDGKRVYFVADARYDVAPNPQGDMPSASGFNLYLAELDGIDDPIELRFVATLGSGDETSWEGNLYGPIGAKSAYASPDGSVLGFGSSQDLTGQAVGGTEQLFVYNAEGHTLECASCPPDGSLPAGDVNTLVEEEGVVQESGWQRPQFELRWVSSEGSVFFHTPSALVDRDENVVDDVYEYRDGQLRLIGTGGGSNKTVFVNASRDGSTVFFNTVEALAPQDEEPGIPKIYAARVGGGFPFVPKEAACDVGAGACEGAGTSSPAVPGAGTAAFQGPADRKARRDRKHCPKGKRKVRRKGKVRCAPRRIRKHRRKHRTAKHNRRAGR